MQLTTGSFTGSTSSLGWIEDCNIYILYQSESQEQSAW